MITVRTGLETLSRQARNFRSDADSKAILEQLAQLRRCVADEKKASAADGQSLLEKLDGELSTWQQKLPVILKEPVGRQGMAKHAAYWADQFAKFAAEGGKA